MNKNELKLINILKQKFPDDKHINWNHHNDFETTNNVDLLIIDKLIETKYKFPDILYFYDLNKIEFMIKHVLDEINESRQSQMNEIYLLLDKYGYERKPLSFDNIIVSSYRINFRLNPIGAYNEKISNLQLIERVIKIDKKIDEKLNEIIRFVKEKYSNIEFEESYGYKWSYINETTPYTLYCKYFPKIDRGLLKFFQSFSITSCSSLFILYNL